MEVHHHPHAEKKKLREYISEFLMISLAVMMGFFSENIREHFVNKEKEKQYIQSFYDDLSADELQLPRLIKSIERQQISPADSLSILFEHAEIKKPSNQIYLFLREMIRQQGIKSIITDRTIDQAKNAGEMRLITDKQVSDSLTDYYKQVEFNEYLQQTLLEYKNKLKEDFPLILKASDYNKATNKFNDIVNPDENLYLGSVDPYAINKIEIAISEIKALSIVIKSRIAHLQQKAIAIKKLIAR